MLRDNKKQKIKKITVYINKEEKRGRPTFLFLVNVFDNAQEMKSWKEPEKIQKYKKRIYKRLDTITTTRQLSPIIVKKFREAIGRKIQPNPNLPSKTWKETFNGQRRVLRHLEDPESVLVYYLLWAGALEIVEDALSLLYKPTSYVLPILEQLTIDMKRNSSSYGPDWRILCEIPNLAGYPKMMDREMTDDPYRWLTEQVKSEFDTSWWSAAFRQAQNQFTKPRTHMIPDLYTYTKNRWRWTTDGATKYSKLYKNGQIVKSKFGAAVSLSDAELLEILGSSTKERIGVFIKPDEKGYKRRLIANVPLGLYICCSHILDFLLSITSHQAPWVSSADMGIDEHQEIIELVRRTTLIPLDESKYDYHVTTESWLGFFEFLESYPEIQDSVMLLKSAFGNLQWEFEGKTGTWAKGMPSGLKLTSYLNSFINYIKQRSIGTTYLNRASGDDALFADKIDRELVWYSEHYKRFGSEVNIKKNWKSEGYAEFLKNIYSKQGISGYPSRIFSSLIWAPKYIEVNPAAKLHELADLWKQFFDRLGIPFDVDIVAKDLSMAVAKKLPGFNKVESKHWLQASPAYGGFGLYPYNKFEFLFKVTKSEPQTYTGNIIALPPSIFEKGWRYIKRERESSGYSFRTGVPPRLKEITTLQEWENRLALKDIPLPQKYKSMYFETIPLPKLPYISTAKLSKLASKYQLYCYPNLKGSSEQVKRRLHCAGLYLTRLAKELMVKHQYTTFV